MLIGKKCMVGNGYHKKHVDYSAYKAIIVSLPIMDSYDNLIIAVLEKGEIRRVYTENITMVELDD